MGRELRRHGQSDRERQNSPSSLRLCLYQRGGEGDTVRTRVYTSMRCVFIFVGVANAESLTDVVEGQGNADAWRAKLRPLAIPTAGGSCFVGIRVVFAR